MAMRTYGVERQGLLITLNELQVLLSQNKETIKNKFELNEPYEEMFLNIDNCDFTELVDFTYNMRNTSFICEFEGYIDIDTTNDRKYYNGEDVIIIELTYNTLYSKYNDKEEVINELKQVLNEVGMVVDDTYIDNHFGYINGSFTC